MRHRCLAHVRQNVVAYLALFVALGGTGAYAANTIGSSDVIDDSLLSADIKDYEGGASPVGGLRTQDLADDAVTAAKIASEGVGSAELADGSVTGTDIGDNQVEGADIKDGAIQQADLAAGAVSSSQIADGSVSTADIASKGLDGSKVLADGTIVGSDLRLFVKEAVVRGTQRRGAHATASCGADQYALSGGARLKSGNASIALRSNSPVYGTRSGAKQAVGWQASTTTKAGGKAVTLTVSAICLGAG